MTQHFLRQIERLKELILSLGGHVEQSLDNALRALARRDEDLARLVIENDHRIDMREVEIEEECLHTLALYQPVASDLRFIISVVKINKDLERIGDQVKNIAEQALYLAHEPEFADLPLDITTESSRVRSMLKRSLDALVEGDAEAALEVCGDDDEVDELHRSVYRKVEQALAEKPGEASRLLDLLNISRQLERIADLAVNIAEDVVYMVRGDILRHRSSTATLGDASHS